MSKYPNCVSENDWRPTQPSHPPGVRRTFAASGGGSTPVVPRSDLHDTRDEHIADSRVPVCYVDWLNSDTGETAQPEPRY
jgi:hypothetical protein